MQLLSKESVRVVSQDEIIVFRQLSKIEVKQISDIMLKEVFGRAEEKGIKIEVTERFKVGGWIGACIMMEISPWVNSQGSCAALG